MNFIKKKIKKKTKKYKQHADYLATTIYLECYQLNELDEKLLYQAKHYKDKKNEKEEEEEELEIPAQLVFGVSMALCGIFLWAIPVPACKAWGTRMFLTGISAAGNSISSMIDKKKGERQKIVVFDLLNRIPFRE